MKVARSNITVCERVCLFYVFFSKDTSKSNVTADGLGWPCLACQGVACRAYSRDEALCIVDTGGLAHQEAQE